MREWKFVEWQMNERKEIFHQFLVPSGCDVFKFIREILREKIPKIVNFFILFLKFPGFFTNIYLFLNNPLLHDVVSFVSSPSSNCAKKEIKEGKVNEGSSFLRQFSVINWKEV